ncbi:MAG: response regulator transcription factor [Planctomycetes bacterium]|nr:response regulator transcription factor [Planctomycetota bacterium]
MRLLVIEDYLPLREAVASYLREEGCAVDAAADGEEGWWHASDTAYDAIILDRQLPGIGGDEILRRLRAAGRQDPVVLLTARGELPDRVGGLDAGADDYLVKPVALPELLARIRALVRRAARIASPSLRVGALSLDLAACAAAVDGRRIDLTAKEWGLLEQLALRQGRVVPRELLWQRCYDFNEEPNPNRIEAHIANLRRKLADAGADGLIRTSRGQGYMLGEES